MSFKVAFIGAGALGFTTKLMKDILSVPAFSNIEIAFMDIDPKYLDIATRLCQRDIDANGLNIKIKPTTDRREAFKDAKYIINCVRVGGLDAFKTDVEIPLKYGVDQCVGDTLCAGGIFYGQRGIPVILDICKDIREVALPGAILLNYSNPNAMMTWAANKYGKVQTIGLCHGVQHGHEQISNVLGLSMDEVAMTCVGINHQTWYTDLKVGDHHVTKDELVAAFLAHDEASVDEKCRINMMQNFGLYSTESNGHLSEYLMWYRKTPEATAQWIYPPSGWSCGETGGYLRCCLEGRMLVDEDHESWISEAGEVFDYDTRSNEHGSFIIEALETGKLYRGCMNVMNQNSITNVPAECVVEVPCFVSKSGVSVPTYGELPLGAAAVCSQSIWVQRLAVEAAVAGDITLLRQALLMDPLTGAVCNPNEIMQMADEMLIANETLLLQYADEIAKAKARLAANYVTPRFENFDWPNRIPMKTVAELLKAKEEAMEALKKDK